MHTKADRKLIGNRLKLLRTKYLKLSQEKLAEILGVKRNTLSNWERGENEMNYEAMLILHSKFGVNINWLLTGEGPMFVSHSQEEPIKETPTNQAGIDRELAQMLSMLSPEQQEGLKMLFRGYLKKPSSKLSASSSERREETANLSNSHDENMVR